MFCRRGFSYKPTVGVKLSTEEQVELWFDLFLISVSRLWSCFFLHVVKNTHISSSRCLYHSFNFLLTRVYTELDFYISFTQLIIFLNLLCWNVCLCFLAPVMSVFSTEMRFLQRRIDVKLS